ncbi:LysR family transcriptional regulator [Catenulispora sp. NF23]|uniref:LysR family transcriptional regulator n=1 Tax=Catenulispora pinistramenti TaxID=2705254 RepID=UPI001BA5BE80|nr:LysR family transcriptional regulator [Catenulispora pinistramenti]MBS2538190.1 LysR family transcriptional regulator [Catenulispora pinistramenti]
MPATAIAALAGNRGAGAPLVPPATAYALGTVELRQLKYFLAVAEELHFGRAAERLSIVQSAVSQQILRLERELRVELLDRTPRRVRLTAAGAAFVPVARDVVAAEQRALDTIAAFRVQRGTVLRLGTSAGMGTRLERVLEALAVRSPETVVELFSAPLEDRLRRVAEREWDAAFVRGDVAVPDGLRLLPVWQDELLVAVSKRHPLAGEGEIEMARLAASPLSLVSRRLNPPLVDLVLQACREAGFEPVTGPGAGSLQDKLAALSAGGPGWTVVYAAQAEQLATGRLAFLRVAGGLSIPAALAVRVADRERLGALVAACRAVIDLDR